MFKKFKKEDLIEIGSVIARNGDANFK